MEPYTIFASIISAFVLVFLLYAYVNFGIKKESLDCEDDYAIPTFEIKGDIILQWETGQPPYVVDPVDGLKIQVQYSDDIFEDADGNLWSIDKTRIFKDNDPQLIRKVN